jgi:hypothetical protein
LIVNGVPPVAVRNCEYATGGTFGKGGTTQFRQRQNGTIDQNVMRFIAEAPFPAETGTARIANKVHVVL